MSHTRATTRAHVGGLSGVLIGVLVTCVTLLTGCVGMPTEGPVEERPVDTGAVAPPGSAYDPLPPQPGQSPTEVVSGFLEAMQATPIRISVALQFLTAAAQDEWEPEDAVITYGDLEPPTGQVAVSVELTDVDHYDERGGWVRTEDADRLDFLVTRENGEWRIGRAPDAVVVPDSWFDDWYERVSLYYFDPTARILVPEPVFVPAGDTFASSLVRGLLAPPPPSADGVLRTFFPTGTEPGLSVPITPAGIAEVSLEGDPDAVDEQTGQRMLAQLVWTLRQDPRIKAVELTVGGRKIGTPAGLTQVNLDYGAAYDPTGLGSTDDLFALDDGLLVRGPLGSLRETQGPLGQADLGVKHFGVSLSGDTVAAVVDRGSTLVVAPVDQPEGEVSPVIPDAVQLLPPTWDHRDRAWVVDRAGGRAEVYLVSNAVPRELVVRGVTGRDVREVLVSRDGSRLLAVVRGPKTDEVVVARLKHDGDGRLLRVLRARPLMELSDAGGGRIHDLAWRTPTAVSVLSMAGTLSEVRTVSVDGAPGLIPTEGSTRPRGPTTSLVSSPVPGTGVYAVGGRTATDLTTPELTLPELPNGVRQLTYAG